MSYFRNALAALALSLAVASPAAAGSSTFRIVVNSADDNQTDGCEPVVGGCTLREAIEVANARSGREAIVFDPEVFPRDDVSNPIVVQSALPPLTQRDGTIVSGGGAQVVIDGSALSGGEHGLVVESGVGRPLSYVYIADLTIRSFPGNGLLLCGGKLDPDHFACDQDVYRVRIRRVVAEYNLGMGIFVTGAANRRTVVEESIARENGGGINLNASRRQALTDAVVVSCIAQDNDGRGINLNASGDNVRASVLRSVSSGNSVGININAGVQNGEARIQDNATFANDTSGIVLNSGSDYTVERALVKDNSVTANLFHGIHFNRPYRSEVRGNRVNGQPETGILLIGEARRNWVHENLVAGNLYGIALQAGSRNHLEDNVVIGNDAIDLDEQRPGCGSNRWHSNRFSTASEPCVR